MISDGPTLAIERGASWPRQRPGAGQRTLTVRDPLLKRPVSPDIKPFTVNLDAH